MTAAAEPAQPMPVAAKRRLTPSMIGVGIVTFLAGLLFGYDQFIFSALCVVTFVFVWFFVPETKGRSLEEVQASWREGRR